MEPYIAIAIALIAHLAATVPKGMIVHVKTTTDCTTTADTCTWGMAGSISETMFKNVYASFLYDATPATFTAIKNPLAKFPNLQPVVVIAVANGDAYAIVGGFTQAVLTAYPSIAGIVYTGYPTASNLAASYSKLTTAKLLFIVNDPNFVTTNFPNAILVSSEKTKAALAGATLSTNSALLLKASTADFTASTADITKLSPDYLHAYEATAGDYTFAHLKAVATYLKTGITCDKSCKDCISAAAADCLSCAVNYTMSTKTNLCETNTTSGSGWISALALLVLLILA